MNLQELIEKISDLESDINTVRDEKDSRELSELHYAISSFLTSQTNR